MTEWRDIIGQEGSYQVSDDGRVRSLPRNRNTGYGVRSVRGRILKSSTIFSGYESVGLSTPARKNCRGQYVHILVAQAFIPNPDRKPVINHKDGNKRNNKVENLEWVTVKENGGHAARHDLVSHGTRQPNAKLTEKDIPLIRKRIKRGDRLKDIAKDFGVCPNGISLIKRNKIWRRA